MAITQLTVYNKALQRLGERSLSSLSDATETRYKLDTAWDGEPVKYCLDLVKPHWASTVKKLEGGTSSAEHGYDHVQDLPADYVAIAGLFSDSRLDQHVERYFIEGRTIACDFDPVYLRYIKSGPASSFDDWTPNFLEVVSTYLAMQVAPAIASSKAAEITTAFTDRVEVARTLEGIKEPRGRSAANRNTINNIWLKIYNDSMQCMGLPHMINGDNDSQARAELDVALENNLVEDLLEEINWNFPHSMVKITADPSLEPEWGYSNAFNKPDDILRLRGIFQDEYARVPLKNYTDESDNFFAEVSEIYLDYIPTSAPVDPLSWPSSFRKLVASKMASDAAASIENADVERAYQTYKERLNRVKSIDANQAAPQRIHTGSWVRAKAGLRDRYTGRP